MTAGGWVAVRRPLFAALLLGCTVSLMTVGTLSARLVAGGALAWSFVPLFEAASLALVGRGLSRRLSFSRTLDLFFAGRGAWSLALLAFGAAAAFADPLDVYGWAATVRAKSLLAVLLLPVAAWSIRVDLCFFRIVLDRTPAQAVRLLFVQRAVSWTASTGYFLGFASAPYLARMLGR